MKNAIFYYYQLATNHVHQIGQEYRFYVGSDEYFLTPCKEVLPLINSIYELTIQLYQRNLYCHQFVFNKSQSLVTYINEIPYVLFRIYEHSDEVITIEDIGKYTKFSQAIPFQEVLNRHHWFTLWTDKIDYMEYQITQLGKTYPLARDSFSYFVGLAENAIAFLGQLDLSNVTLSVCHHRINKEDTLFEFYNPLTFIIDSRVRDLSEYFKQKFFDHPYILEDIKRALEENKLSKEEYILFFIRMLFPTFYFDRYQEVLVDHVDEKILLPIIEQIDAYQDFLKALYDYIRTKVALPEIEWLSN